MTTTIIDSEVSLNLREAVKGISSFRTRDQLYTLLAFIPSLRAQGYCERDPRALNEGQLLSCDLRSWKADRKLFRSVMILYLVIAMLCCRKALMSVMVLYFVIIMSYCKPPPFLFS